LHIRLLTTLAHFAKCYCVGESNEGVSDAQEMLHCGRKDRCMYFSDWKTK
jgi:hypothetical protein